MDSILRHVALGILAFYLLLPAALLSQTIVLEQTGTPQPDGSVTPGEWDKAASVTIGTGSGATTVLVQQDGTALYLAFVGNLQNAVRFPEVLIDPEYDRSSNWNSDDWWFHVSATDCASQGLHSDYTDCAPDHEDWDGVPNFSSIPQAPVVDTVEISIPFEKIGLVPGRADTIGIAFDVTNTFSSWMFWPSAADIDIPSTWGTAIIPESPSSVSFSASPSSIRLACAPNPLASGPLRATVTLPQAGTVMVELLDAAGNRRMVPTQQWMEAGTHDVLLTPVDSEGPRLPAGLYFCRVSIDTGSVVRPIIIVR